MTLIEKLIDYFKIFNIQTSKINNIKRKDKVIFIERTDFIGDYIVSRDFLRVIRQSKKFGSYKIVFLANISVRDIALCYDKDYIDEFIWFDRNLFKYNLYKTLLRIKINRYKYDYALNYVPFRSDMSESIMKRVKAKEKYGIEGPEYNITQEGKLFFNKFYTKLYDCGYSYGDAEAKFAKCITDENIEFNFYSLNLDDDKLKLFQAKFKQPYAILFPSASTKEKRLGFDKFLKIAEYYARSRGGVSYICGSSKDNELLKGYDLNKPYIKNLCGKYKLSELPYLFKDADIIFTNDTCAMHIGHWVNNKNIVVFCNVRSPDKELLKSEINANGEQVYFCQVGCFHFIYPQISCDAVFNNTCSMASDYEPTDKSDITIGQDINGIEMKNIFYTIDKILAQKTE